MRILVTGGAGYIGSHTTALLRARGDFVVVFDSMASVHQQHGRWLKGLEWFFTLAFTLEYIARLLCVSHPLRYARSFFGIIDLLAILPAYLAVPQVLACGGSWMVKRELIAAGDFEAIGRSAAEAVALARASRPGLASLAAREPAR